MQPAIMFSLLLCATPAFAKTQKIAPENLRDAQVIRSVPVSDQVGEVRDLLGTSDTLYVAGTKGIAALADDGSIRWSVELPTAAFRWIDVGEQGVAVASYSLEHQDPAAGFNAFLFGKAGERPRWTDVTVSLVDPSGALRWTVPGVDDRSASRPTLGEGVVAVSYGPETLLLAAGDGHVLGTPKIEGTGADTKVFGGILANTTREQPVVKGGTVYAAFLNKIGAFKLDGTKIEETIGGLPGIQHATCGLVSWQGRIWLGNALLDDDAKPALFSFDPARLSKGVKKVDLDDTSSGCSELVPLGDTLIAVTNFQVTRFDAKGKELWVAVNKKGGIYPSESRGLRYQSLGASWSRWPVRKVQTQLVVADEKAVFVPARIHDAEHVVVLDTATGAHVATLKLPGRNGGMVLRKDAIVVAGPGELTWFTRT